MKSRHLRQESHRRLKVAAFVLVLIAVPLAGQAASRFVDVTSDNPLAGDIEWLDAWGIAKGCSPTHFCPTDPVTREQMAALLHRFALSGAAGGSGPAGAQGPVGPQGPAGPAGSTVYYVATATADIPRNSTSSPVAASCDPGNVAVGGGFEVEPPNAWVLSSQPIGSPIPDSWEVAVQFGGGGGPAGAIRILTVYAVCLDI